MGLAYNSKLGCDRVNFYIFQWEYYAIIKNDNKPIMDYYGGESGICAHWI